MKRIISLALALSLMLSLVPVASAATTEQVAAANNLYQLGLFKGVGTDGQGNPDFALDRAPNRNEAVTMLVRLLGKETEALNGSWSIPFNDVDEWAKPYVGYAYANGLTTGTSATTYSGKSSVTATQYITFVLRALGYSSSTDFKWDSAWELSDKIGLTKYRYDSHTSSFTRGDVALVSFDALDCTLKGNSVKLIDTLGIGEDAPIKATEMDIVLKDGSPYEYVKVGEKVQARVEMVPSNAVAKKITWSVDEDDADIATVDQNGVITGLKPGAAFINAETEYGVMDIQLVFVTGKSPVKVKNISAEMNIVGGTTFTFDVQNNGNKTVKYVTIEWQCLNAVGDVIPDVISWQNSFVVRVTGPIAPGQTFYDMQNVRPFYNHDFSNGIKFVKLVVDYMDGTTETIDSVFYTDYWDLS